MPLSLNDNHHLINYHYVEDPRDDFKGAHPCPIAEFERQVKFMTEHGRVVAIPELVDAALQESEEKLFAITFDDGLLDQYENAVPILKKYATTAAFFPITKTFDGLMPQTHKMHLLLSRFPAEELIDEVNGFIRRMRWTYQPIPKDRRITEKRKLRDDVLTANFKEMLNVVSAGEQESILNALFEKLELNEKELSGDFFMTPEQLKGLSDSGFEIGYHSHNHYALDLQPREVVKEEFQKSKEYLLKLLNKFPTTISYPHGGANKMVCDTARAEGFTYGLTIELRPVTSNDDPMLLPRYDTNDLRDALTKA
ncbi:hypothetical protein A3D66_02145 [Candidatus Kaiserbacteria bacterium RIFCSPHIGHO2_02_FULL_50_9]|uniref:NodB homology domain-containing protein n=1 Tax=Candidatus Kaiserbacteria bacterium RIFCSPLOWO2_01_FULL_51_21 TaxID=1798508 RepID=A0A1F6EE82_9BACT|nr:MAG: hypothetical protein A2761_02915 [Candidatus Kaiserbacteria bacterium RIFCSPHIGHO2_01_FULL_51_33]OGG63405.1 MAG: hypothetical protein A3D66_02145 [Candidatus Kaiserbacteria bacterium RIFCSPHIGHO2_02_FULL_50_9]OGG71940.1 MAG: hypothetical protein A3A35_02490 [Candidatus Kaiserbacteria bacterium RIFCSPLOWO2_01_FULL_51_21]